MHAVCDAQVLDAQLGKELHAHGQAHTHAHARTHARGRRTFSVCSSAQRCSAELPLLSRRVHSTPCFRRSRAARTFCPAEAGHKHTAYRTAAPSVPGLGSPPATSAPGLGSPLPHLRRDCAHPLPHLHRDWAASHHEVNVSTSAVHAANCTLHVARGCRWHRRRTRISRALHWRCARR